VVAIVPVKSSSGAAAATVGDRHRRAAAIRPRGNARQVEHDRHRKYAAQGSASGATRSLACANGNVARHAS
jgi:hypothetical protein